MVIVVNVRNSGHIFGVLVLRISYPLLLLVAILHLFWLFCVLLVTEGVCIDMVSIVV